MTRFDSPAAVMRHAISLAERGLGAVEPNPQVGAVIVDDQLTCLGEGWHERFGGPHAEIHALEQAGAASRGATLYVTLEPCCHFGKTPPCTQAVIAAGIRKVVLATTDPNPQVAGQGMAELCAAGIIVELGLFKEAADDLIAPFRQLMLTGRPWIIAKWAMTLDGKIASRTGDSQWISGESSRALVHELRGRVDGIMVGIGTAIADDPLLNARPAGLRTATRIVVDRLARLPVTSKLMQTAHEIPVLLAVSEAAPAERLSALRAMGADVVIVATDSAGHVSLPALLQELGRRRWTHLLVEGGGSLLGGLFDQALIDEVYAFVSPKLIGGRDAVAPLGGLGHELMSQAVALRHVTTRQLDNDILIHGRIHGASAASSG